MAGVNNMGVDGFLSTYPNTTLVVNATAVYRKLPINDTVYARAHAESPWREQGDIVFLCSKGNTFRTHRVLLNSILPVFVNDLLKIQPLVNAPINVPAPLLPVFVSGIDASCVKNFLALLNTTKAEMTCQEISQMKKLIEVLGINELSVSVAETGDQSSFPTSEIADLANSQKQHLEERTSSLYKQTNKRIISKEGLRDSVLIALRNGGTVSKVAAQFNLTPKTISRWKYNYKKKLSKTEMLKKSEMPNGSTSMKNLSPTNHVSPPLLATSQIDPRVSFDVDSTVGAPPI